MIIINKPKQTLIRHLNYSNSNKYQIKTSAYYDHVHSQRRTVTRSRTKTKSDLFKVSMYNSAKSCNCSFRKTLQA